ncbi:chemerin-like receptor 1 [Gopherus flavomarginatus]|uniref:chemerin-like receptor 1 n=1 Tax=Gopherus flavomarginatus TaxID=286002 RepID=UPI0021CC259E|nr:chemerin-like receptor 1 [Gopherus flavomarginatus]XP_050786719.1 chemerin-like receptor 1 [Gopherus flavomarginatus]
MAVKGTSLPTTPLDVSSASYYDDSGYDYEDAVRKQALFNTMHVVTMIIYSIAFVLGVTGNGLVIFITGFRMKRTVNTIWFLNLAVADFIFTFFLPLSVVYTALGFHWPFGRALCKINSTLAFLNLYASVYLLMVISIDRCISVLHPVWAQNHRTPNLALLVALGVWVLALVLCSPNLYFRHTAPSPFNKNITNCYNNFDTAGEGATNEQRTRMVNTNHRAMIISRFILGFYIPFSVILGCYGAIWAKLKRNQLARSGKPFKVIAAVIVAFFLCWLPYHIFSFLELKRTPSLDTTLIVGLPLTASLAFINSCLNPILYVFMGQDFKEKLRRSLFSAFESAFSDEAASTAANTKSKSTDMDSQVF